MIPVWVAAGAAAVLVLGAAFSRFPGVWLRAPQKAEVTAGSTAPRRNAAVTRTPAAVLPQGANQQRDTKAALEESLRSSQSEQANLRRQLDEEQHRSISLAQD